MQPLQPLAKIAPAFAALGGLCNRLVAAVNLLLSIKGVGAIIVTQSEKNIVVALDPAQLAKQVADAAAGLSYPFKTLPVLGAAQVVFVPGTVEGIMPKIGASWAAGTFINDPTPPELTVATGSNYFDCTMDGAGRFTEVMIKNGSSVPSNTSTHRYWLLSTVTVSGTVVTVTASPIRTSLSHVFFAGASTWGPV